MRQLGIVIAVTLPGSFFRLTWISQGVMRWIAPILPPALAGWSSRMLRLTTYTTITPQDTGSGKTNQCGQERCVCFDTDRDYSNDLASALEALSSFRCIAGGGFLLF